MTGLLFDVDGVLIDSTPANFRVWRKWAQMRDLDPDVVVAATYGRRGIDTLAEVAPHLEYAAESAVINDLFDAELHSIGAMPGAFELLSSLPAGRWGCVTSGGLEWVTRNLTYAGLPLPEALVTSRDVEVGKPHPACYLLGAERLGLPPAECLVIEDAAAGIEAGHAAGMEVVGLATTHSRDHIAAADYVFDSLAEAAPFLRERLTGR